MALQDDIQAALDALLEAAPALSGVALSGAQREAVMVQLRNSLAIAANVGPVPAEAAPVFKA